jgi:hypothetical protein
MQAPHATANCLSEIPHRFCSTHIHASCSRHAPFMYSLNPATFFNFFAPRSTICALLVPHTHASRSRRLHRHVPFMYSRASRSFSHFVLARDDCHVLYFGVLIRSSFGGVRSHIRTYVRTHTYRVSSLQI